MAVLGIFFGLLCAVLISLSYLYVRQDMMAVRGGIKLLIRTPDLQEIVCIIALPWL